MSEQENKENKVLRNSIIYSQDHQDTKRWAIMLANRLDEALVKLDEQCTAPHQMVSFFKEDGSEVYKCKHCGLGE